MKCCIVLFYVGVTMKYKSKCMRDSQISLNHFQHEINKFRLSFEQNWEHRRNKIISASNFSFMLLFYVDKCVWFYQL